MSQWAPTFELLDNDFVILYNTFHSVFPYVYVYQMEPDLYSQLIFIGSQKPLKFTDNELYFFSHEDIVNQESELNTDDKPLLEFSTALSLYRSEESRLPVIPILVPEV